MSTYRTTIPNSLNEHWMPFTANREFKKSPRLITGAKGVYLKTQLEACILFYLLTRTAN